MCDSQHTECWESYLPLRKESIKRECFQASIKEELSSFEDVRTPVVPRGPNFQSQGSVSHCIFWAFQRDSQSIPMVCHLVGDCPWGRRHQECVWECWVPFCGPLVEVTFQCKWSKQLRATRCFRNPNGEAKPALSEIRKQQFDGFSSSC